MKVLSLFDGMACMYLAMQAADLKVDSYDAYEIDETAIRTAVHNFPDIREHGDVFEADFTKYENIDILAGGVALHILEHSGSWERKQRNHSKRSRLGFV